MLVFHCLISFMLSFLSLFILRSSLFHIVLFHQSPRLTAQGLGLGLESGSRVGVWRRGPGSDSRAGVSNRGLQSGSSIGVFNRGLQSGSSAGVRGRCLEPGSRGIRSSRGFSFRSSIPVVTSCGFSTILRCLFVVRDALCARMEDSLYCDSLIFNYVN